MSEATIIRSIGELTFDATFSEQHDSTLEVSDNPVESGVTVSDHAYMLPLKVVIQAGVSDLLLRELPTDIYNSSVSRSRRAYELLLLLQSRAEPFDVVTGLKVYKNMVCLNLRAEQDKETSSVLGFTSELREVIIVSTQVVRYPPRQAGKTTRQAAKPQEKGKVNGKDVSTTETSTPSEVKKKQSLAKKLRGLL